MPCPCASTDSSIRSGNLSVIAAAQGGNDADRWWLPVPADCFVVDG